MEEDDGKSNTIKIYNPTYLLKPRPDTKFIKRNVEAKMMEILEAKTKDVKYEAEEMANLCKELCTEIQNEVKKMGYERYKLVTQVIISESKGQGQRIASRCLWDPEEDNFAQVIVRNSTMMCMAITFGCFWE
eukprot:GGOE01018202.1.p2 GENE.GGOE01018202.1~~GGOE01018202.1.p2  ORF type:complete len:141 (-),score=57.10 GGOE01018202.1:370-765(-)